MAKDKDKTSASNQPDVQPGDVENAKPGGDGSLPVNMTPQPVSKTEAERANRIRDERKFNGVDELRAQIEKDTRTASNYFRHQGVKNMLAIL